MNMNKSGTYFLLIPGVLLETESIIIPLIIASKEDTQVRSWFEHIPMKVCIRNKLFKPNSSAFDNQIFEYLLKLRS